MRGGKVGEKSSVLSGKNFRELPETINEEVLEQETPLFVRQSRFQERRDYNEFGSSGHKRYKSDDRGKRRRTYGLRGQANRFVPQILTLPSTYVSETDEEESGCSNSSNELARYDRRYEQQKNSARQVMSLAHFSQLINKRIFSDDFDRASSDKSATQRGHKPRFGGTLSMID